jgi:ubiquinone/menaquinone biosynthesis C-methylase UbiE
MGHKHLNFLKEFYLELETVDSGFAFHNTHLRNDFVLLEYERITGEIVRHLGAGDKLLDWGCGIGHMMYLCAEKGRDITVHGYDMKHGSYDKTAEKWQLLLRKTGLLPMVKYGAEPVALPYRDNEFDGVMSIGVLEHVAQPMESILEINRILKPGGYFFIYELPNYFSYGEWMRKKLGKGHHQAKYRKSEITAKLRSRGFEIISTRYASLLPRRLKHWKRLVPFVDRYASALDRLDRMLSAFYPVNRLSQSLEIVARKHHRT